MSYLEVSGGKPLFGEICVQGSKNAVLPILSACLCGEGVCVIENCPMIADVEDTLAILRSLGCEARREGHTVRIDASGISGYEIKEKEALRIRSSVLFLGALLGKMKKAVIPHPGGCAIGTRPVDLHLAALEALGATISIGERITACAPSLHGAVITLRMPSVGATENAVLAAVWAQGDTVIQNAAMEPEIDELCAFLRERGAVIGRRADGAICIEGGHALGAVTYRMRADRIVTGTYLLAGAVTGGTVKIRNENGETLSAFLSALAHTGTALGMDGESVFVQGGALKALPYVETAPYPGFPTDLQSPLMAALCRAEGESRICERIFENRFCTALQLRRLGARIETCGRFAKITGVPALYGAAVEAPDLRGGAALVLAALQAEGCTVITNTHYIKRGYEDIGRDLAELGADIRWVDEKIT